MTKIPETKGAKKLFRIPDWNIRPRKCNPFVCEEMRHSINWWLPPECANACCWMQGQLCAFQSLGDKWFFISIHPKQCGSEGSRTERIEIIQKFNTKSFPDWCFAHQESFIMSFSLSLSILSSAYRLLCGTTENINNKLPVLTAEIPAVETKMKLQEHSL